MLDDLLEVIPVEGQLKHSTWNKKTKQIRYTNRNPNLECLEKIDAMNVL